MAEKSRLLRLKNIGVTVAERLHEIGVFTREDLERIGAVEAYRRIKRKHSDITLPRCYYLYSLEGALRDVHWDSIPDALKRRLSQQAGLDG
jgi:DNA transformation protein